MARWQKTATKLDSLVLVDINGVKKMRVEHYANLIPNWIKYTKTFGKAGTVRTGKDGKVVDHGVTIMMVGYADHHEGNCYRMFNPLRNSIVESGDVTWLCRMYYQRLDADVTGLDPPVVIEANYARDEVME